MTKINLLLKRVSVALTHFSDHNDIFFHYEIAVASQTSMSLLEKCTKFSHSVLNFDRMKPSPELSPFFRRHTYGKTNIWKNFNAIDWKIAEITKTKPEKPTVSKTQWSVLTRARV